MIEEARQEEKKTGKAEKEMRSINRRDSKKKRRNLIEEKMTQGRDRYKNKWK